MIRRTLLWLLLVGAAGAFAAEPELVELVKAGERDAALAQLAAGAAGESIEPDGTTALHWAVRADDVQLAQALLDAGAAPIAANRYDVTPLRLAATNGSAPMIERLLQAGASARKVGIEGETVLMLAARTGVVEAAKLLLEHGADVNAREQWHGETALMLAAAQGHPDMLQLLIEHGADVNALSAYVEWERQLTDEPRNKWLPMGGFSALMFAARENCVACVPVLAAAGAQVDTPDPEGVTPLISSITNGHYDVAAALLDAGADPNIADDVGQTPLYAAVHFNSMPHSNRPAPEVLYNEVSSLDLIRRLLAMGANVNAELARGLPVRAKLDRGNDGMLGGGTTSLLRAAKAGDTAAMRLLLDAGADATLATRDGINALMAAANLGTTEQDTTGRYKTEAEAIEAIRICLAQGLDPNATDRRGRTALHGAAQWGLDEVIRFLADNGARPDIADNSGATPLDVAKGLAGGFGFDGQAGIYRESTVTLITELLGAAAPSDDEALSAGL